MGKNYAKTKLVFGKEFQKKVSLESFKKVNGKQVRNPCVYSRPGDRVCP